GQRPCPGAGHMAPLDAELRIKQEQIVRDGDWLEPRVWILGFAWPFILALLGIVLTATGLGVSEQTAFMLMLCSFMGSPVVIACIHHWLPERWPAVARVLVTVLLGVPCILGEAFLALLVFGVGYVLVGGYIPC